MSTASAEAASTCRAHCESHYCHLEPDHLGLHETSASERLSTGTRRFGDLYPAGWTTDDSLAPDRARRDARTRALTRLSIARLRHLRLGQLADVGRRMLFGGPESMSKDELIAEILRWEFPLEDRCDPGRCRWPEGPHSPLCVRGTT